jgi:hypothetical protein
MTAGVVSGAEGLRGKGHETWRLAGSAAGLEKEEEGRQESLFLLLTFLLGGAQEEEVRQESLFLLLTFLLGGAQEGGGAV